MEQQFFLSQLNFFILLGSAFTLSLIPYVKIPFQWAEVFFHELSHGLVAALTGGKIVDIQINFNGSGVCRTRGGLRIPTLFAGYAGASLWGAAIFLAAQNNSLNFPIAEALCIFILACYLVWGKGFSSFITTTFICAVIYLPQLFAVGHSEYLTALFGLHVCINALKAPLDLLSTQGISDASELAKKTLIPSFVWVAIWLSLTAYIIYLLWKVST